MYVIDQYGKNPIFQINNHIGFDADVKDDNGTVTEVGDGQGIDGKIFSREFFETDSLRPDCISVYTNCMGGDVQNSLDMFTAIVRAKSRTKGIIAGFAYSCGGWLPLGCDIVEMTTNSRWMCHLPFNPNDESKQSQFLETVADMIATTIADKSGRNGKPKKTKEQVIEMMKKKTYLTAQQMSNEGLIDKVVTPSGKIVKEESIVYNMDDFKEIKTFYKEKQVALNSLLKEKNNHIMSFEKVVNRLNNVKVKDLSFNLAADSSEQAVIESIASMENKLNAVNLEKESAENKLKVSNETQTDLMAKLKAAESKAKDSEEMAANDKVALDKMKAMCENFEADNKIMKEKMEKVAADAKTSADNSLREKCKNLVKVHDEAGKFKYANKEDKDKVIKGWEEKAFNDYEGTELILDAISVSAKAPRPMNFEATDENRPDMGDGSASNYVKQNRERRAKNAERFSTNSTK